MIAMFIERERGGDTLNKRSFVIVVLSALCITMILAVPTNSLVGYYDPWLDYDDDGDIDMKDVAASARAFGSFGDPTKNVTVTNWPVSSQVIVWDYQPALPGGQWSPVYDSSGFCRLHILAKADGLAGSETATVRVLGQLYYEDGGHAGITAYTITLTATSNRKDATIFVPGETFQFVTFSDAADTVYISLNFYLTWA